MANNAVTQILASYSPEDTQIVLSNSMFTHTISGYADGTFITVSRVIPHATLYTGADGSNARVVRAVKNCDVTLTLHNAAESNDILSQLLLRDEESRDGRDTFSITIKDNLGRTVASAGTAFIGTSPDTAYGIEITEVDWGLHAIGMSIYQGGNGKLSPEAWDTLTALGGTPDERWKQS